MNTVVPPLLRRPRLLPGESFPSWLLRLAASNYYEPPSLLSGLILGGSYGQERIQDRLRSPSHPATYDRLAALTGQTAADLHRASPHAWAHILTPPEKAMEQIVLSGGEVLPQLAKSIMSKQLRKDTAAQYCPRCLSSGAYHRLLWMPLSMAACLEHASLLMNCCGECEASTSIRDIVRARCSSCGADLTEAPAPSLHNDAFGLFSQQVLQSWLRGGATPASDVLLLPAQPARVLYRVMEGLRQTVIASASAWPYLHHAEGVPEPRFNGTGPRVLSPAQSYCTWATATSGLLNWPSGFYAFLDAYQAARKSKSSGGRGIGADLGMLYTGWIGREWQHQAFAFVQEAFDAYVLSRHGLVHSITRLGRYRGNTPAARRLAYINVNQAALLLGSTPRMIDILLDTGRVSYRDSEDHGRNGGYRLVNRADVLKLSDEWSQTMGLEEAATFLGISEDVVRDMVAVGLLAVVAKPEEGFPRWMFSRGKVEECSAAIRSQARDWNDVEASEQTTRLSLAQAAQTLFPVGLGAASILMRVAHGMLQAYVPDKTMATLPLRNLLFTRRDIVACIEAVKMENGWIGRDEVTKLLGVKDATLKRWVERELISPVAVQGSAQYFDRATVDLFWVNNITSGEAATLLGVGQLTIQRWAHEGRFYGICVSGPNIDGYHSYLFKKESLAQWWEGRLTFGQAVQILGVSKATFQYWIKQGKIAPLEDMQGKHRWFSRQDILHLREKGR